MGFTGAKYYLDEVRPDVVVLFKDKEKAHIPCHNVKKQDLICPCCGSPYQKSASQLYRNKNILCDNCNDGFSSPEKFIMSILSQLNIDYIYQYTDDWTKNYKYDFQFEYLNKKYIIEADGGLGHGNKVYDNNPSTLDKSIKVDLEKDTLAIENGFIMIRIDCNYNHDKFNFLEKNCKQALSPYLQLENVDWEVCKKNCLTSKFKETIDCYKTKTKFTTEIADIVGIKPRTVIKYLKEAMKIGIIPKRMVLNKSFDLPNAEERENNNGKFVYCYEDDKLFNTQLDASKNYGFNYGSFRYAINHNKNGLYKEKRFFIVENVDDIAKIKEEQSNITPQKNKRLYQYDKNKNLIKMYNDYHELPKEFLYSSVVKACNGSRKTAYGYIWKYEKL